MPRILFVSGFHPPTRARDLAYEFERCATRPPRSPCPSYIVPTLTLPIHPQVWSPCSLRRPCSPQPPRKLKPVSRPFLFVQPPLSVESCPVDQIPLPAQPSPPSSASPRYRAAVVPRVESFESPSRAGPRARRRSNTVTLARTSLAFQIRFALASPSSSPPEQSKLNVPLSPPCSYAFVEFRSQRDAEDAYYDM